jgi:hypothetical protein
VPHDDDAVARRHVEHGGFDVEEVAPLRVGEPLPQGGTRLGHLVEVADGFPELLRGGGDHLAIGELPPEPARQLTSHRIATTA